MGEFERACHTENYTGETTQENVIEWIRGDKEVTVTFANNTRHKTAVMKLAESHPEEVKIVHINKDGSIVAHLPFKCIKIQWPRQVSDETKEKFVARMQKAREQKMPEND